MRKQELIPYYQLALRLMTRFYFISIKHINQGQNAQTDALAKLASSLAVQPDTSLNITVINCQQVPSVTKVLADEQESEAAAIEEVQQLDWWEHLLRWFQYQQLSKGK